MDNRKRSVSRRRSWFNVKIRDIVMEEDNRKKVSIKFYCQGQGSWFMAMIRHMVMEEDNRKNASVKIKIIVKA